MTLFPDLERELTAAADRLTDQPGPLRARTAHPRRRRAIAIAAVTAVVVAAVGFSMTLGAGSSVEPALAAKTYAAVDPGGAVVHFVFDTRYRRNGVVGLHVRTERWQMGKRAHTRTIQYAPSGAIVAEGDSDGTTARFYEPARKRLFVNTLTGTAARTIKDPFTTFRKRYRAGAVKDVGPTTINGRSARQLRIKTATGTITYIVGPKTGAPLAIRVFTVPRGYTVQADGSRGATRQGSGNVSRTTRVLTYERLPANSANRELLRMKLPAGVEPARQPSRRLR